MTPSLFLSIEMSPPYYTIPCSLFYKQLQDSSFQYQTNLSRNSASFSKRRITLYSFLIPPSINHLLLSSLSPLNSLFYTPSIKYSFITPPTPLTSRGEPQSLPIFFPSSWVKRRSGGVTLVNFQQLHNSPTPLTSRGAPQSPPLLPLLLG